MTIGLSVNSNGGLEAPIFSESGHGKSLFYLLGTGLNNSSSRIVTLDGTSQLTVTGRGMALVVWDGSTTTKVSDLVYDIYGDATKRDALANALIALPDDRIFCLTTYDAIHTSTALTTCMQDTLRSQYWAKIFTTRGSAVRTPYCCIGVKRLGILAEVAIPDDRSTDPKAELYWTYEDYESAGSVGYGPVTDWAGEHSYEGDGYYYQTGTVGVKDNVVLGEWFRLTCQIKVDAARAADDGYCRVYLWNTSDADSWEAAVNHGTKSTTWVDVEIYLQTANGTDNSPYNSTHWGVYHHPNDKNIGVSYIRNVAIQRCGMNPKYSSVLRPKVGKIITTARRLQEEDGSSFMVEPKVIKANHFKEI